MALEAHVTWWCTEIGNTTLTHVKNNRTQILRPKKKHRRKKKLMNRKRMPQHFIEAGLHWIKTLLIRGSVSLLANSVCLWFSSYNSFLGSSDSPASASRAAGITDDSVEPSGTKKEDLNDKKKKDEEETPAPVYRAKSILDSWVWGKQPDVKREVQRTQAICHKSCPSQMEREVGFKPRILNQYPAVLPSTISTVTLDFPLCPLSSGDQPAKTHILR
nr:uncharacterized protein LOC103889279 isoform X4 [Pongo abelii]